MNEIEQYEFDRLGYVIIANFLSAEQVGKLAVAVDELEEHALHWKVTSSASHLHVLNPLPPQLGHIFLFIPSP